MDALDYPHLIIYMKELRSFFQEKYGTRFKYGKVYQGSPDYSYFSLATDELKKDKLKFVIILNHKKLSFSICLSGQNKNVRRKCWELLQDSYWDTYPLAESMDDSLSIVEHTIVEKPGFVDRKVLFEMIEKGTVAFMNEFKEIL